MVKLTEIIPIKSGKFVYTLCDDDIDFRRDKTSLLAWLICVSIDRIET